MIFPIISLNCALNFYKINQLKKSNLESIQQIDLQIIFFYDFYNNLLNFRTTFL